MLQDIIVYIIVGAAFIYCILGLFRHFRASGKGVNKCASCTAECPLKKLKVSAAIGRRLFFLRHVQTGSAQRQNLFTLSASCETQSRISLPQSPTAIKSSRFFLCLRMIANGAASKFELDYFEFERKHTFSAGFL